MRFIHLSDSHIGALPTFELLGVEPYKRLQTILDIIEMISGNIDFIVHTGDLTSDGSDKSFQLAEKAINRLSIPFFWITGNHDLQSGIDYCKYQNYAAATIICPEDGSYTIKRGGICFLFINSPVLDENPEMGFIPEGLFHRIQSFIEKSAEPLVLFLHFPPLKLDSKWLNRKMLLQNGEDFHGMLAARQKKILAVFFGHAHQSMQVSKDGIFYVGATSTFCQFRLWPDDDRPKFDTDSPGGFNLVTIDKHTVLVKNYQVSF